MTPQEEIAALKAENAALREQVTVLVARVHELEGRLAKDSHTSSKPPSTDGLARKTKSLRRRSGKKPGGQVGQRGETLRLVATPESVVEHRPTVCAGCQAPLGAETPEVLRERRQVHELPTLRLVVREHQAIHLRCLTACRSPLGFFTRYYRQGVAPAWTLGIRHGLFCLGCCWALMLIMFGIGVGSLAWMAGLAGVMVVEKALPGGRRASPVIGVACLLLAALWLAHPVWLGQFTAV